MANTNVPAIWGDLVTDVRAGTSAAGQAALYPVGLERREGDKTYVYVKFDNGTGNIAAVAGNVCYWSLTVEGTVTSDESDSDINFVAGVFAAVIADAGYGWIQRRGICTVNTGGADNIAKSDAVIATSTDGKVERIAADAALTNRPVGFALADDSDSANTVSVYLML